MSETEKVNPFSFLKNRGGDGKMHGINKLLTSDKDNETKTRIPHVLGMTYLDCMGFWASPNDIVVVKLDGDKTKTYEKTVEGIAMFFGDRYRINAISKAGQSRLEYVDALKSYLAAQLELNTQAQQARVEEGAKKSS